MASRIPLGRSAIYDVLVVPVRSFDLDRLPRTEVHRCLPRAPRQQPRRLLSRPTAGVPPHPLDEAVGFDSPVGRPSGAPSPALRKVRFQLEQPRTRPMPMHCSRADSACPFHCCRPVSRVDLQVRRPSRAQPMRACADALGNVRHTSCGGRVARSARALNRNCLAHRTLGRPHTGPGCPRVTCMGHGDPLLRLVSCIIHMGPHPQRFVASTTLI